MADLKITQLPAVETPVDADLFETVQDVGTTPANKKITWTAIKAFLKAYFDTLYGAGGATALTIIPQSAISPSDDFTFVNIADNTIAYLGQVIVPFDITVNKVSFRSATYTGTVEGKIQITLYSEDGQTKLFSVITASNLTADAVITTAVSAVEVPAGIYYVMFSINGTGTDLRPYFWTIGRNVSQIPFTNTAGLSGDVASEPVMQGTLTIPASTPPATITPTSITESTVATPIIRLDN